MLTPFVPSLAFSANPKNKRMRFRHDCAIAPAIIDLARANFHSRGRSLEKPACFKIEPMAKAVRPANKNIVATRIPKDSCHDMFGELRATLQQPGRVDTKVKPAWPFHVPPGTISSSRCQITRACNRPLLGT